MASSTRAGTAARASLSMITAIESFLGKPVPARRAHARRNRIHEVDFLPTYLKAIERLRRPRPHLEIRHEVLHRLHVRRRRHHPRRHLHPHRRRSRADSLQSRSALSRHQSRAHRAEHPRPRRSHRRQPMPGRPLHRRRRRPHRRHRRARRISSIRTKSIPCC